jgi:hypothetical protein
VGKFRRNIALNGTWGNNILCKSAGGTANHFVGVGKLKGCHINNGKRLKRKALFGCVVVKNVQS